jgi:hypothetical protein
MNSALHGHAHGIVAAGDCMKDFSWISFEGGRKSTDMVSLASFYTPHWNGQVLP